MKSANTSYRKISMGLFDFFKKDEVVLDEKLSTQVQQVREEHKAALRQRLLKYRLTNEEIDNLFLIFTKAEEKIEKIQKSVNYKTATHIELLEMQEKVAEVQQAMKQEFEENLNKILKHKYNLAKKILKEINENKKKK